MAHMAPGDHAILEGDHPLSMVPFDIGGPLGTEEPPGALGQVLSSAGLRVERQPSFRDLAVLARVNARLVIFAPFMVYLDTISIARPIPFAIRMSVMKGLLCPMTRWVLCESTSPPWKRLKETISNIWPPSTMMVPLPGSGGPTGGDDEVAQP